MITKYYVVEFFMEEIDEYECEPKSRIISKMYDSRIRAKFTASIHSSVFGTRCEIWEKACDT